MKLAAAKRPNYPSSAFFEGPSSERGQPDMIAPGGNSYHLLLFRYFDFSRDVIGASITIGHPDGRSGLGRESLNVLLRANDLSLLGVGEHHIHIAGSLYGDGLGTRIDFRQLPLECLLGLWCTTWCAALFLLSISQWQRHQRDRQADCHQ